MKSLEDYLNDPTVAKMPMPLREVKAIRLMIYDETKDMTSEQLREHYDRIKQRTKREFGLNYVPSVTKNDIIPS